MGKYEEWIFNARSEHIRGDSHYKTVDLTQALSVAKEADSEVSRKNHLLDDILYVIKAVHAGGLILTPEVINGLSNVGLAIECDIERRI
jgi:hypothetical protein